MKKYADIVRDAEALASYLEQRTDDDSIKALITEARALFDEDVERALEKLSVANQLVE